MKKSRFTEEQIAFALKQAETGTRVEEVCRKMGISEATFYNWKKKFGGMGVTELRRLRQREEENHRLKRLVAYLLDAYRIGLRRGCRLMMQSRRVTTTTVAVMTGPSHSG